MADGRDYTNEVKDKSSEEILANPNCNYDGPIGEFLRTAAQVRSLQELIKQLERASADSSELQCRLFWLTVVIALAGCGQALATAWPYLVPWLKRFL